MNVKFDDYSIRSYQEADIEDLQRHADNIKIWQNLRDRFPSPYTMEDAREWLTITQNKKAGEAAAICHNDRLIGAIGIEPGVDVHFRAAELGYWLGEDYWGKGIMTQAIKLYTDYVMDVFELIRVYAMPFEGNKASARVLEKAGYEYEGNLRLFAVKQGKAQNVLMYSKIDASKSI